MTSRSNRPRSERRKRATDKELNRLRAEISRLRAEIQSLKAHSDEAPALPAPDADGNYPAEESLRAILAQQLIRRRESLAWSKKELAARAGVREETVSRLEAGELAPNVTAVDKLDRALKEAGA